MDAVVMVLAIILALWHFFLGLLGNTAESTPGPKAVFMLMSALTVIVLVMYVAVPLGGN